MVNHSLFTLAVAFIVQFLIISPSFDATDLDARPMAEITDSSLSQENVQTYPERLTELIKYFDSKDIDLKPYLDDPDFEIYDGIGDRFRRSAERKIGSFTQEDRIFGIPINPIFYDE